MTVAEMSRVDLTSDGWASSGGDAGESAMESGADIPLPGGGAAHSPLAWPITGNLLADSDDPRGLREDLRPHVLPTAVGFLTALAVHLTE
jgi:hypothetical protein